MDQVIAVNFQKFFQLYQYTDIYKFKFIPRTNDGLVPKLRRILTAGGVEPETDLQYMLYSKRGELNILNTASFVQGMVIVVKLSYTRDKLTQSIINRLSTRKNRVIKSVLNGKRILKLGKSYQYLNVLFFDDRTILIGTISRIKARLALLDGKKPNLLENKGFKEIENIFRKRPIVSYLLDFSPHLKSLLYQKDESFKLNLARFKYIIGYLDSDKISWSGHIDLISFQKKNDLGNIRSLRKLVGMAAMRGPGYIKLIEKIHIHDRKNGIQIFFTFDVE